MNQFLTRFLVVCFLLFSFSLNVSSSETKRITCNDPPKMSPQAFEDVSLKLICSSKNTQAWPDASDSIYRKLVLKTMQENGILVSTEEEAFLEGLRASKAYYSSTLDKKIMSLARMQCPGAADKHTADFYMLDVLNVVPHPKLAKLPPEKVLEILVQSGCEAEKKAREQNIANDAKELSRLKNTIFAQNLAKEGISISSCEEAEIETKRFYASVPPSFFLRIKKEMEKTCLSQSDVKEKRKAKEIIKVLIPPGFEVAREYTEGVMTNLALVPKGEASKNRGTGPISAKIQISAQIYRFPEKVPDPKGFAEMGYKQVSKMCKKITIFHSAYEKNQLFPTYFFDFACSSSKESPEGVFVSKKIIKGKDNKDHENIYVVQISRPLVDMLNLTTEDAKQLDYFFKHSTVCTLNDSSDTSCDKLIQSEGDVYKELY